MLKLGIFICYMNHLDTTWPAFSNQKTINHNIHRNIIIHLLYPCFAELNCVFDLLKVITNISIFAKTFPKLYILHRSIIIATDLHFMDFLL